MTGVEYYRCKRRMTKKTLAELSGVNVTTIANYEGKGIPESAYVSALLPVADALGVKLDELLKDYDGRSLSTLDRAARASCIRSPRNAVDNYRVRNNLRFQELADRLGLADRESARTACKRETARGVHIVRLANYEQITTETFLRRYLPKDGDREG